MTQPANYQITKWTPPRHREHGYKRYKDGTVRYVMHLFRDDWKHGAKRRHKLSRSLARYWQRLHRQTWQQFLAVPPAEPQLSASPAETDQQISTPV